MPSKSSFFEKVLARLGRLDKGGLESFVQRLARERRLLETVFNVIEDGVLVADEAGRILYFNQGAIRLLGLPADAAEGQLLTRFLPDLDWNRITGPDRAGGDRLARHELEVFFPRPRFLSIYAAPLDGDQAGSTGVALVIHDATEARQKTADAVEAERTQALTQLAGSVAHEIGNPLNALSIHLQLIERELRKLRSALTQDAPTEPSAKAPRSRRGASEIRPAAADRLAGPLNTLERYLGVAKGEVGRLDYVITEFLQAIRPTPPRLRLAWLNEVVQETVDLLQPEIENRRLNLAVKLDPKLPRTPLDRAQIKQVLVNLCKNALQATNAGGTLTLQTQAGRDGVWVVVADTGGGIPPELLGRIFEPFYTTKSKGSGLGLMIVRRIIRDHGGRIEVESHVGKGTVFRAWLPMHQALPRLLLPEAGGSEATGAQSLS